MNRDNLQRLGIQVPALPTVVLGGLPGEPDWAPRLAALGLDVVCSGATEDTVATATSARQAVPHRPCKAIAGDAAELAAAGFALLEGPVPEGVDAYRLSRADAVVAAVNGRGARVEDFNEVARAAIRAARGLGAAHLWVGATPGLDDLPVATVEAKLAALVEGAHQARLAIAKDQFDLAELPSPSRAGS